MHSSLLRKLTLNLEPPPKGQGSSTPKKKKWTNAVTPPKPLIQKPAFTLRTHAFLGLILCNSTNAETQSFFADFMKNYYEPTTSQAFRTKYQITHFVTRVVDGSITDVMPCKPDKPDFPFRIILRVENGSDEWVSSEVWVERILEGINEVTKNGPYPAYHYYAGNLHNYEGELPLANKYVTFDQAIKLMEQLYEMNLMALTKTDMKMFHEFFDLQDPRVIEMLKRRFNLSEELLSCLR